MASSSFRLCNRTQPAIDQERVPEPAARIAPEGLAIIGLGGSEVFRGLCRVRCPRTDLSRGEPAKQIEPGQLGMGLQARRQIGPGPFGVRSLVFKSQMASRHWAQKWFGWACRASAKCRLACVM